MPIKAKHQTIGISHFNIFLNLRSFSISPSRLSCLYIGRDRIRQRDPTTRPCSRDSRSQPSCHVPGLRCMCLNRRIRPY